MSTTTMKTKTLLTLGALLLGIHWAGAQGSAFTYQGHLNSGMNPATGSYDLKFTLYDAIQPGGNLIAGPMTNATSISNGLFTVALDFGATFPGADRWLEIAARTNGGGGFVTLIPRQKITPAPYAIYAANAASAATAGTVSGSVPVGNLTGTLLDSQLSGNVALLNRSPQTFSGPNNFLGNVGIGTATPAARLEINQNYTGGSAGMIHLQSSGTEAGLTLEKTNGGTQRYSLKVVNGAGGLGIRDETAGGAIRLQILNTNGNVGIGTPTPGTSLEIRNLTAAGPSLRLSGVGGPGAKVGIDLATYDPVANGTSNAPARIEATDDNWSAGINFLTKAPGSQTNALLSRLFIQNSGRIGIGTGNPEDALLDVEGDTHINDHDIFMRTGSDRAHGIGYRGTIAGSGIDGPFLYGWNGGALGVSGPDAVALSWNWEGNVWVTSHLSTGTFSTVGNADLNGVTRTLGGLVIETRTVTDPVNPALGRIWLRTDL